MDTAVTVVVMEWVVTTTTTTMDITATTITTTATEWAVTTTTTTVVTEDTDEDTTEDTMDSHPSTSCTKNKITNAKLASGIKTCITTTDVDTMDKTTMVTKTTTPVTDIIKQTTNSKLLHQYKKVKDWQFLDLLLL